MIRKAIIVVMTLAAIGTGGLWFYATAFPILKSYGVPEFVSHLWRRSGAGTRRYNANPDRWYVYHGHFAIRRSFLIAQESWIPTTELEFGRSYMRINRYVRFFYPIANPHPGWYSLGRHRLTREQTLEIKAERTRLKETELAVVDARVPLWAPLLLFAAYPTLSFIRGPVRRYRRRKRGLCARCGYNLTGLTEPKCPECGEGVPHESIPAQTPPTTIATTTKVV